MDLLLGQTCVGCARPGRLLCRGCAATVRAHPAPAWPDPVPPGLVQPWAATSYEGVVRAMVVGHKEHQLWSLARPLGRLLAGAVRAAVPGPVPGAVPGAVPAVPVLLVPVPSRGAVVRRRGHAPTLAVVRSAARHLRATGTPARVLPLLASAGPVLDQAGLGASARAANLAGALWCPDRLLRRASGGPPGWVVLCDDVVTTGSTLREAQRALAAVGVTPLAAAVVAATRRRRVGPRATHRGAGGPDWEPLRGFHYQ